MTDSHEQERIRAGLRRIRFLRTGPGVIVMAFVPLVYLLYVMALPVKIFMSIGAGWVCLGVIVELIIGFSRCPACRGYYHVRGMSGNIFARRCMNCGIPLKEQG